MHLGSDLVHILQHTGLGLNLLRRPFVEVRHQPLEPGSHLRSLGHSRGVALACNQDLPRLPACVAATLVPG